MTSKNSAPQDRKKRSNPEKRGPLSKLIDKIDEARGNNRFGAPFRAGMLVRQLRNDAGMSQRELGEALGISQARVSEIEAGSGPNGPTWALMERIAKACNREIGVLPAAGTVVEQPIDRQRPAHWIVEPEMAEPGMVQIHTVELHGTPVVGQPLFGHHADILPVRGHEIVGFKSPTAGPGFGSVATSWSRIVLTQYDPTSRAIVTTYLHKRDDKKDTEKAKG